MYKTILQNDTTRTQFWVSSKLSRVRWSLMPWSRTRTRSVIISVLGFVYIILFIICAFFCYNGVGWFSSSVQIKSGTYSIRKTIKCFGLIIWFSCCLLKTKTVNILGFLLTFIEVMSNSDNERETLIAIIDNIISKSYW